jgi:hypothetical protein
MAGLDLMAIKYTRHIEDPSHELQEQGLALLRNICCEGSEEEIELVFNGFGEAPLFDVIEKKLAASDPDCLEQVSQHIVRGDAQSSWLIIISLPT